MGFNCCSSSFQGYNGVFFKEIEGLSVTDKRVLIYNAAKNIILN